MDTGGTKKKQAPTGENIKRGYRRWKYENIFISQKCTDKGRN